MITIGLTGGIASGKSLLAAHLAARGALVIDADRIGHEVMRRGTAAFRAVVAEFGAGILEPSGEIDRAVLGPVVFADPERRKRLEAIVHPPLLDELRRRIAEAGAAGVAVVVVDAALIYEFGLAADLDRVVVVQATEAHRLARLQARGLSEEEARRRVAAQLPAPEKARRADLVVDNDGSPGDLAREAGRVWKIIEEWSGRGAAGPRAN